MKKYVAAAVATLAAGSVLAAPSSATQVGNDGCTPGYWKNHTQSWQEYRRTDTLGGDILSMVNGALDSRDRARMLAVATTLDDANNLSCPLN